MKRIPGVDIFRIIAIVAVIIAHATASPTVVNGHIADWSSPYLIANQVIRFTVPYFITISGYFWGKKIVGGADVLQSFLGFLKRILIIYLAWSLVYLLPYDVYQDLNCGIAGSLKIFYFNAIDLTKRPLHAMFFGTMYHLYFLPALMTSATICACFVKMRRIGTLIVFSAMLYIVGLLNGAYAHTPMGIHLPLGTRSWLFEGPGFFTFFGGAAFFASGYILSTMAPNRSWLWKGCGFLILGYMVHFIELYFLITKHDINYSPDCLFGTYFMGIGCALIALSNALMPRAHCFSTFGSLTLGVYGMHLIYFNNLDHARPLYPAGLWYPFVIVAVYLLSVSTAYLMAKNTALKRIVA